MRIATKISATFSLWVVVAFIAYAYVEINDDERALHEDARMELSAVALESATTLSFVDPMVAAESLRRSYDPKAVVKVQLVRPDLEPGGERVVEDAGRITVYRAFAATTGETFEVAVSRSTEAIDRFIHYEKTRAIWLIAVVIALGLVFALVVGSRIVARPMRELIDSFRRVGRGDLSPIPAPTRRDEFGLLTRELADMTRQLSSSRESLVRENAARLETLGQLQHAERLTTVGKLASGVAHELGTPLNVISGYARLIANGQETGAGAVDSARIIDEQTQRITKIVRQLLDFVRRGKPQFADVDLRVTVSRALELAGVLAKKRDIRLEYEPPDQPLLARIDDGRIQQVIVNLVQNAIHASPSGQTVQIRAARAMAKRPGTATEASYLRLDVVDHGSGIPPEDVPRVFEPFFTTKQVGEGTGLGLSVSHGIVEEHDGWFEVSSQVGTGSSFTVYLPEPARVPT